jgi:predicted negative regulator of RcsB-dependent stress response
MPPKIRKKSEGGGLNDPDQVMVGLQSTYGFLDKYKIHIIVSVVGVIVALLAASGYVNYKESSRRGRAENFFAAFKYADAPVGEELKGTDDEPAFASEEAKFKKLSDEMQTFLTEYESTEIGNTARLVLASSKMELGEHEAAYELLNQFQAESEGSALAPIVFENLGYACMNLGKIDEAVANFEKMKDSSSEPYIVSRALIHLGDLFNPGATSSAAEKSVEKSMGYYKSALEALPEEAEGEVNPQRFPVEEQTRKELQVRMAVLERG